MNFETNLPFDKQLAGLLAIIIMSQSQIQQLKKKLAGNQQFHTRLVFERLDYRKKGEITPDDIISSLPIQKSEGKISLQGCQMLCRKYTTSGTITYDELLSLITPKTDKSLAQRVLLRTSKRGSTLPSYLWSYFCQLLVSITSVTFITQQIRRKIQNCAQLNHLEMIQFFRRCLKTKAEVWKFCNTIGNQTHGVEYDFSIQQVKFLGCHLRSRNQVEQFTDQDIKQLICPLDMNFQKTLHQMGPYYQSIKLQKQKALNNQFYNQTKAQQMARQTKSVNFLNSNYRSFYPVSQKARQIFRENTHPNIKYNLAQKQYIQPQIQPHPIHDPTSRNSNQLQPNKFVRLQESVAETSQMYLDKFIKPVQYSYQSAYGNNQSSRRNQIQLNKLIGAYGHHRNSFERFDDQLPENLDSSKNSAFVQY